MTARTHDAFAFASLITIGAFFPPENLNVATLIVSVIGADIGALIPDMDGGGNRLWHMLPAGEKLGKVLRRVFYKHRTLSHSLIGGFLIFKFLEWVLYKLLNPAFLDPQIVLASIMIGYISHIIADMLTEEGVPLLFPININFGFPPIKKVRIKTGKSFENFVVYPAIWVYLIWFINANQEKLIKILQSV
jgi:inner membrane protein